MQICLFRNTNNAQKDKHIAFKICTRHNEQQMSSFSNKKISRTIAKIKLKF